MREGPVHPRRIRGLRESGQGKIHQPVLLHATLRLPIMAQALGLPQVPWAKPEGLAVRHQKVRTHHLSRVQTLQVIRHKKDNAKTVTYNALEHIRWSGIAKHPTLVPPVPVYSPSVGDWV
ncbi:uncharacterized protein LY79DRAFT_528562 [Colletotrichum navitas]|uniref:Uncharacterized protein n=1 Tax=Colletotrichum navitas TaxID=681940 RepID=A0AAD8UZ67_9PEZI|nr:uncharacterized protein LY79DRAFT_528562 [Colletotrichum navitas]KAK1569494.1 hypothetical protein LY79DRAFT_528562 [Colletotrichum navitas]